MKTTRTSNRPRPARPEDEPTDIERRPARRRFWRAAIAAASLAVLAIAVACSGGSDGSDVTLSGSRAAPDGESGSEGEPSGPAGPAAGVEDSGTATPEPSVGSIEDLVSEYGHPPGYDFARIRIPLLNVDAPVGISVVDGASGTELGVPEGPATVFWYNLDAWPGLGGLPGGGGNAIFSAHVDISAYLPYADVTYHGPAVFRDLELLQPGDQIFVDRNGVSLEYIVEWTDQVKPSDSARWGEIWSDDVETDSITLYTCGGDFDAATASYADRYVVRAVSAG